MGLETTHYQTENSEARSTDTSVEKNDLEDNACSACSNYPLKREKSVKLITDDIDVGWLLKKPMFHDFIMSISAKQGTGCCT